LHTNDTSRFVVGADTEFTSLLNAVLGHPFIILAKYFEFS